MTETVTWILIGLCLLQSGMFSGLNLALLGPSRMDLETHARAGNERAARILEVRRDTHLLLTTILWGNVSVNCLLTLLSDSVLTGLGAFVFSTFGITLFGEIIPQAYYSRYALSIGSFLVPVIRVYQLLLYPLTKPSSLLLDRLLGSEEIAYLRERDLREVIRMHAIAEETDLSTVEATGALNFLALDDIPVAQEGEVVEPASVVPLPLERGAPVAPRYERSAADSFVRQVQASGRKWVILTDGAGEPHRVLDADAFLRDVLFPQGPADLAPFCHRPIVVHDPQVRLGPLLRELRVEPTHLEDDVIDRDLILLWGERRRIVTGADLLGRLLRGIAARAA